MSITLINNEDGKEYTLQSMSQLWRVMKETKPADFFINLDILIKKLELEGTTKRVTCSNCGNSWEEPFK